MRRKQIILGTLFLIFLVVSTPILATELDHLNQISDKDLIRDYNADQRELYFQTIIDVTNNGEIKKIVLDSQMRLDGFFIQGSRFSVFSPKVLTKKYLDTIYHLGIILSKTLSKSKIHLMIDQYQLNNQGLQKKIIAVIEKDSKLNGEITRLANLKCDCEKNNSVVTTWKFPITCFFLLIMLGISEFIGNEFFPWISVFPLSWIIFGMAKILDCDWAGD